MLLLNSFLKCHLIVFCLGNRHRTNSPPSNKAALWKGHIAQVLAEANVSYYTRFHNGISNKN